jgi:hypothetical protein
MRTDHSKLVPPELQDRQDRRPVQLRGYAILGDGRTLDVTVLDLSYDGCCLKVAEELNPREPVKLSVSGLALVEARVRWSRDGRAGLKFTPNEPEHKIFKPRAAARVTVDIEVSQRRPGQPNYRVRLFDVSRTGCKAEFVERPRAGDRVWIKFEGLESLEAEVCWTEGYKAGLKYANPIHPAVFDLLAIRFGAASPA